MPNQFLSDEFGDIEDYFVTDYWLIDNFVGDSLWGWGRNDAGQLGIGVDPFGVQGAPVTTFAGGTNWKQVSTGYQFTAAIKTDGTLWMWGNAGSGRLGTNDTTPNRRTPVTTFAGETNWKQVACGREYAAAIKTDGSLWLWGSGGQGRLGTNNTTTRSTPVTTFAGGTNWKQVSAGNGHTAAIKTDGSLWTWGLNSSGQLGIDNTNNRLIPVTTFAGGNTWKSVACGSNFTAAIKTDGSLWVWGSGADGKLGTNDTTPNRRTPVTTFAGGNNWKSIFFDGNAADHMAAIKTDGSLWTWGNNGSGRLGTNDDTTRSTPVTTFAGGNNWKQVSCGKEVIAAIKTDGTLWGCGQSTNSGQLGSSNTSSTPVTTFAGGTNWKQVSATQLHSSAVKSGLNVDLSFFPVGLVTDGLVLHLDAGNTASYPGSGTTWNDLSGNGNTGTLINMDGTNFNSANGGSLTFDGSDERVDTLNVSSLTNMTIEIWIYDTRSSGNRDILTYYNENSASYTFNGTTFRTDRNGAAGRSIAGVGNPPLNTWYRFCYVKNGDLYINETRYTGTGTDHTPSGIISLGNSRSDINNRLNGRISNAKIYNRALTAQEIQQNFNFYKSRFGL